MARAVSRGAPSVRRPAEPAHPPGLIPCHPGLEDCRQPSDLVCPRNPRRSIQLATREQANESPRMRLAVTTLNCERLDIVAELRLRQWARRNYVPATERSDADWHPVVLKEMEKKDAELAGDGPVRMVITSNGVAPLEPSRHDRGRIDGAHEPLPEPRILRQTTRRIEALKDR